MSTFVDKIKQMSYVEFMAFLDETNRPPGGKNSVRLLVQNTFLDRQSKVLDVGCNTGYCTFEIAHLVKCSVIGIDVSQEMINKANQFLAQDKLYTDNITFQTGDAQQLNFYDNSFDLVMSGGSTVFVDEKEKAFSEYKRVCKDWGFIGDIIFYYREQPPAKLLEQINDLLGIKIDSWDRQYWEDFYDWTGLERYYTYSDNMRYNSDEQVKKYVKYMSEKNSELNSTEQAAIYDKLLPIMQLFNENHKYLDCGVFIMRQRPTKEEPNLFNP